MASNCGRPFFVPMTSPRTKTCLAVLLVLFLHGQVTPGSAAAGSDPVELGTVEVNGAKLLSEPSHPTLSTSVLTAEAIELLSARNLGEALQFLPGITTTRGTKRNRIRVSIRGFNPRYVKIYIDGIPANPATDETVDLSTIPVEHIEKIEVIKGPAPVKYGAGAMAGVILITTKEGDDYPGLEPFYAHSVHPAAMHYTVKEEGELVTRVDDKGLYHGDRFGLSAGAGDEALNGYAMVSGDLSQGYRPHSAYRNDHAGGKVSWSPSPWTKLTLTGGYFMGDRELVNPSVLLERRGQYGSEGGGGAGTGPMHGASDWRLKDWHKGHAAAVARFDLSEGRPGTVVTTQVMAFAFHERYRLEVTKPNDLEETASFSRRESLVAGGELQNEVSLDQAWPFRIRHLVSFGGSGRLEQFSWGNSVNPARDQDEQTFQGQKASVVTLGLYIQDAMELAEGLHLVAGVRYDRQTRGEVSIEAFDKGRDHDVAETSPHLSFLYGWGDRVILHGAVGRTYRFPRLRDRYDYVAGNPDLAPETAWDFEVGADIEIHRTVVLKVSAFHNEVDDLIYSPGKFIQFENIAEARFRGFEAEVLAEPVRGVALFANYTYMDGRDLESDVRAPYTPEHKIAYGGTFSRWRFRLSYQGVYVSGRTTGDALTPLLPPCHVADVKLARGFDLPRLSVGSEADLYVAVQNLFDERYQEILGFPLPGVTVLVGGSMRWGW